MTLVGKGELRQAKTAQRTGRRHVGIERVRIDPDVLDVVGARGDEAGFLRDPRPDIGVGAPIPKHLAFARRDAALAIETGLDAQRARVLGDLIELLLHRERNLYRAPHQQRECRDQRFKLDVELRPISAAEERHLDVHAVLRPAQQPRDLAPQKRRPLRARVDGDARIARIRNRRKRLKGEVKALLGAEGVLENMRGCCKSRLHVAAAQRRRKREIGALLSFEMLEVGKCAGRPKLVMDGNA